MLESDATEAALDNGARFRAVDVIPDRDAVDSDVVSGDDVGAEDLSRDTLGFSSDRSDDWGVSKVSDDMEAELRWRLIEPVRVDDGVQRVSMERTSGVIAVEEGNRVNEAGSALLSC